MNRIEVAHKCAQKAGDGFFKASATFLSKRLTFKAEVDNMCREMGRTNCEYLRNYISLNIAVL